MRICAERSRSADECSLPVLSEFCLFSLTALNRNNGTLQQKVNMATGGNNLWTSCTAPHRSHRTSIFQTRPTSVWRGRARSLCHSRAWSRFLISSLRVTSQECLRRDSGSASAHVHVPIRCFWHQMLIRDNQPRGASDRDETAGKSLTNRGLGRRWGNGEQLIEGDESRADEQHRNRPREHNGSAVMRFEEGDKTWKNGLWATDMWKDRKAAQWLNQAQHVPVSSWRQKASLISCVHVWPIKDTQRETEMWLAANAGPCEALKKVRISKKTRSEFYHRLLLLDFRVSLFSEN